MKIATSWTTESDADKIPALYQQLTERLESTPDLLVLHCSVTYDVQAVMAELNKCAREIPLHGGTSCLGVMTEAGFHSEEAQGLGLLGLSDPEGAFGVGYADLADDPANAARTALSRALDQANCPGETPVMIWMTAVPGYEEVLIESLTDVVGNNVPIAGGSAADNTVTGEWSLFCNGRILENAVVITVMFPSSEVFFAFHSGYEPTEMCGTVTAAQGRELIEIDGSPSAKVYNDWTGGVFTESLTNGGNILSQATLHPLGARLAKLPDCPISSCPTPMPSLPIPH